VFDVVMTSVSDPVTLDSLEQARAANTAYAAVLGDVDAFAPALWALAVTQDFPRTAETCITADGAAWIWSLAADLFLIVSRLSIGFMPVSIWR
jgi:hypothetical protein